MKIGDKIKMCSERTRYTVQGFDVGCGDWISFSYGIPPVGVYARITERKGVLFATVLGRHRPREVALKDLRKYVGAWFKSSGPS